MTPDLFQTNDRRVNADMVQLARASRGMTQAEAADAASVTQALLSKIENKLVVNPSEDIVAAFARALRYPVDFFYQTGRTHGLPQYHYRKRSKLGAKTLATIQAVINIRRQHVQKLVRSVDREIHRGIPQIDLDETNMTPAQVAEKMREYWMVPRGPLGDVTELVETAGGIVILSDFGTRFLDAISFRLPGLPPLFFMNRDVPGDRYRFTLCHELGHMIMHNGPGDDETMEGQADAFAAAFLMPAADIRPQLADVNLPKLGRLKPVWRVAIKALVRRAYDLKMITPHQYKYMNMDYNKAGYNAGEPFPVEQEQPTTLSNLIDHHMRQLGYSVQEMAQTLLLEAEEFKQAYLPRGRIELVVSN